MLDSHRQRAQLLVVGLGLAVLVAVAPFASGLLGAAALYVVLAPAHRRVASYLSPRLAAVAVVVAAVALLVVPGVWLASAVIEQAPGVLHGAQESLLRSRAAAVRVGGIDLGAQFANVVGVLVSWLSAHALDAISGAVSATLNLVIALLGLYYLLVSGHTAWERLKAYLPFSAANADILGSRFVLVTEATLLGTALTAVLQGSIVGVGFRVVGLANPLFWGAVTALVSILPVLGSAIVWLPGVLVLLAGQRFGAAVALAVIGGVVASNIDNIARPLVNRQLSDLHPMTTVVGAFAGVGVFGIAGLLLGPLAISYFFELVRIYRQEYGEPSASAPLAHDASDAVHARVGG